MTQALMERLPATETIATSRQHPFLEPKANKRQSSLDFPLLLEAEEVQILPGMFTVLLHGSIQTKETLVGDPEY